MINTLNESQLHRALKTIYSLENEGSRTEVSTEEIFPEAQNTKASGKSKTASKKYIFDIVTSENNIIEIQTGSLAHLTPKILYVLSQKKKITVVYPLVTAKYIETWTGENSLSRLKSRRKSPASKNIYSIFRELTSFTPFLTDKNFTLEIVEITETEIRLLTENAGQSQNKRRRFQRNWIKMEKKLESVGKKYRFNGKKSYLSLLPETLSDEFTAVECFNEVKKIVPKVKRQEIQLLLWVFSRSGIIAQSGKRGKAYLYIQLRIKN